MQSSVGILGWDAVNDMRRNTSIRYKYLDLICRMENDKLLACPLFEYNSDGDNAHWYPWTSGLNDDKWEKLK